MWLRAAVLPRRRGSSRMRVAKIHRYDAAWEVAQGPLMDVGEATNAPSNQVSDSGWRLSIGLRRL
jgi:hypothetical protein